MFAQGRTWPEAFDSGVLPADAVADIKDFAAGQWGMLTLPEHGELCPFNSHGWGFGLLQHDFVKEFLIYFFGMAS